MTEYSREVCLIAQLRAARADHTLDRKMLRLTSPELLVIDDLGLRPLTSDEPIDLYEIEVARRSASSAATTLAGRSTMLLSLALPYCGDACLHSPGEMAPRHGSYTEVPGQLLPTSDTAPDVQFLLGTVEAKQLAGR